MIAKTLIWRHRKEKLKKCSLRGLESREDVCFFKYPNQQLPPLDGCILLTPNSDPLTPSDNPILLLDATWKLAEVMKGQLRGNFLERSLPGWKTAYPRRQEETCGLASVEALFAAYSILGRSTDGLLSGYHWTEEFLEKNSSIVATLLTIH